MADGINFEGLGSFNEKLQQVISKYPFQTEEELGKLGKILKKNTQDKTPQGATKKLKKSYKLSIVQYNRGGNSFITFSSNSPHFHLIERGHKILTNSGSNNANSGKRRIKKGQEVGFAPGIHMLENSVTELDNNMESELNSWMDKLLEGAK